VAQPARAAGCAAVHRSGRWATIDLPATATVDATAAIPRRGKNGADVLVAGAGRSLLRSADGGCTWTTVLSLDALPATSAAHSPLVAFWTIAVSPAAGPGPRSVYVVAGDGAGTVAVALPVLTFVSPDDGVHWTTHEAGPADLAGDFPRCSSQTETTVRPGPDPASAYLLCRSPGVLEVPLVIFGPLCSVAFYVTHDAARTWRPISSRLTDPTAIGPDNVSGCHRISRLYTSPVPDEDARRVLWVPPTCEKTLLRSADDGATLKPYATLPAMPNSCLLRITTSTLPNRRSVVALCDAAHLWVVAPSGQTTEAPVLPLKLSERGSIRGCDLVRGTDRVLVSYVDGNNRPRAFGYDITHRSWQDAGLAPALGPTPAWHGYDRVVGLSSRGSRDVYLGVSGGTHLFRVAV
jgi:hypothetical protein